MGSLEQKNTINEILKCYRWAQQQDGGDKERISELKVRTIEITHSPQQRENRLENTQSFRNLWDYHKRSNIHFIRVLEGKEKKVGLKKILEEVMPEKSPDLANDINLQID